MQTKRKGDKKMKNSKIITALLCFTFVFTSMLSCFPVFNAYAASITLYDDDYANAKDVLTSICPSLPLSNGEITTRADFVAAVTMMLGIGETTGVQTGFSDVAAEHKYSGNIKYAVDLGLISGGATFSPDSPVTYIQAIKILTSAAGYGTKAGFLGGYPTGYLKVASEANIGGGVDLSADDALTHDAAMKLILDAVCTDMLDVTAYGDDIEYAKTEGRNILSVFHEVYIANGIADANKSTGLYSASAKIDESGIRVNGKSYYGEGYNNLLGKKVRVFFKGDKQRRIICAYPVSNKVYSFDNEDDLLLSGGKISAYIDGEDKETNYSVSSDYTLIYNGKYYPAAENTYNECINPDSGYVELVDNNEDGKIEVISVKDIDYGVVGSVNIFEEKIYDKFKAGGMKDLSGDIEYFISDSEGTALTLEDLAENNVLGYAISKDGTSVEIIRYSNKIGGTYNEYGDGILVLGEDKNLTLSNYFVENIKTLNEIAMGTQLVAYLGIGNQAVFIEEYSEALSYGFLADYGEEKSGIDSKASVMLYDTEGVMNVYNIADKIVFNGTRYTATEAKAHFEELNAKDATMRVIRYALNEKGELSKIYSAVTNERGASVLLLNSVSEGSPVLFDDNSAGGGSGKYLNYTYGFFYPYFPLSPGGAIVKVPLANENRGDLSYYGIYTSSSLTAWADANTNALLCYGYDVTKTGAAFVLWTTAASGSASVGHSTPTGIVESVTTGSDVNGNIVKVVNMYVSGKWVRLTVPTEFGEGQESFKEQLDKLQVGDLARVSYDKENVITALQIDFSYQSGKKMYSSTDTGASGYNGRYVGCEAGYAYNIYNSKATVVTDIPDINVLAQKSEEGSITLEKIYPVNLASGTTVFVEFNRDRNTGKIISADVYKEPNTNGVESYFSAGLDADYIVSRSRFHAININVDELKVKLLPL